MTEEYCKKKAFFSLKIKMSEITGYKKNRNVILNKAKDYYKSNKERLKKQARDKYRSLSEEDKNKRREYGKNKNPNMSKEIF